MGPGPHLFPSRGSPPYEVDWLSPQETWGLGLWGCPGPVAGSDSRIPLATGMVQLWHDGMNMGHQKDKFRAVGS